MEGNNNDNDSEVINGCHECGKIEDLYPISTSTMPERVTSV